MLSYLLACTACNGSIGDARNGPGGSTAPGSGNGRSNGPETGGSGNSASGNGGTGNGGGGTVVGAKCKGVDPGPSVIRRMTRVEYGNTVRDLLGATMPVASSFPTEEKRLGFDNNASALTVSPLLAEQYLLAAEKLASDVVTNNLSRIVPCDPVKDGVDPCGEQFITSFGKKAYRRPLAADEVALLTSLFNVGKTTDFNTGVRLVVAAALQSPQFLYRVETGLPPKGTDPKVADPSGGSSSVVRLDAWEMASRLSYLLWRTMPDDELFRAAEMGKLTTTADINAQVTRMLSMNQARDMVGKFHHQWLHLGELDSIEKNESIFEGFTPAVARLMQQETHKLLDHLVWDGDGTFESLFSVPFTFVNGPLAAYYGIAGVTGNDFVKVQSPAERGGLLTQGGLLSLLAKDNQTSPILRGEFVREQLFCEELPPPPPDIDIVPPELSSMLTTRERFAQHSKDPACSGCHALMDPIGLGFEHFDGGGKYRTSENGRQVDATGNIKGTDVEGPFNGVLELQKKLAKSDQVRQCVITGWFRYAYGRGETDADDCSLEKIQTQFAAGGYKVKDLLVALTQTDAFLYRRVTAPAGGGK